MRDIATIAQDAPLTDLQERFALGLSYGLGPTIAARVAGYKNASVMGARLGQDPRMRQIIHERRKRRIDKMSSLSLWELEHLIRDRKISPAVKLNAIKLSLGMAGYVEKPYEDEDRTGGKRVSEMSLAELDAFIAGEKAKRAEAARPVLDGEAVASAGDAEPSIKH